MLFLKKYSIYALFFFCLTLGLSQIAQAEKGCIATFDKGVPTVINVDLPPFSKGLFQTEEFRFTNLPNNMVPDSQGYYCYDLTDERFAFVQTYYYAVREMQSYETTISDAGLASPQPLAVTLVSDTTSPTGGDTDASKSTIHYPRPALDPASLQREIGFWVYYNVIGQSSHTAFNPSSLNIIPLKDLQRDLLKNKQPMSQNKTDPSHMGWVNVAAANTLAILFAQDPNIAGADWYEVSWNWNMTDTLVSFPNNLTTLRQILQTIVNSPQFTEAYPVYVGAVQDILNHDNPNDPSSVLNQPDPNTTAAAIAQPLWEESPTYSFDKIRVVFVKALAKLDANGRSSYADLVNAIIETSSTNTFLQGSLKEKYKKRGFSIATR